MKRRGLVLLTLLTFLGTGLAMNRAGWFADTHSPRRLDSRGHAKALAPAMTDAAWRYRRGQPVHWRAMMLQR